MASCRLAGSQPTGNGDGLVKLTHLSGGGVEALNCDVAVDGLTEGRVEAARNHEDRRPSRVIGVQLIGPLTRSIHVHRDVNVHCQCRHLQRTPNVPPLYSQLPVGYGDKVSPGCRRNDMCLCPTDGSSTGT